MKTQKLPAVLLIFLCSLLFSTTSSAQQSAIYAGGPIYKNPGSSINELRNSGYKTVIVWTIHIEANGDLGFNGEFPLVRNGVYIGDQRYPGFRNDVSRLKQQPTSIDRIEFGLSAAGSGTFDAVRNFYNNGGFGPGTTLRRNFEALRRAFPTVDALNNDDESTYHAPSAVAFTKMLASLGFKNAIVPYRVSSFWRTLVEQVNATYPGNIDRNYLQCYAGGQFNNPCAQTWNFGIPVYPGLWGGNGRDSVESVRNRMNGWKNQCGISGGFMWLYDDFDNSPAVANYANAINDVFGVTTTPPPPPQNAIARFYQDCPFTGKSIALGEGDYVLSELRSRGMPNDSISSVRVQQGYEVELFFDDNFGGRSIKLTQDDNCLNDNNFNDFASSIKVRRATTGANTATTRIEAENFTDMSGIQTEPSSEGGENVGYTDSEDFLVYNSVNFPVSGTYTMQYRVASAVDGGRFSVDLNAGETVLGEISVPNTGGWQNWTTVSNTVTIAAGTYPLGIFAQSGGWNLNWFSITGAAQASFRLGSKEAINSKVNSISVYPNPVTNVLSIESASSSKVAAIVYDLQGRKVVPLTEVQSSSLDLSALPKGAYLLQTYLNGKTESIQKIIKQ